MLADTAHCLLWDRHWEACWGDEQTRGTQGRMQLEKSPPPGRPSPPQPCPTPAVP